jgi:hypothetical protein
MKVPIFTRAVDRFLSGSWPDAAEAIPESSLSFPAEV